MKIGNKGLFVLLLVAGIIWGIIYWVFLAGS